MSDIKIIPPPVGHGLLFDEPTICKSRHFTRELARVISEYQAIHDRQVVMSVSATGPDGQISEVTLDAVDWPEGGFQGSGGHYLTTA